MRSVLSGSAGSARCSHGGRSVAPPVHGCPTGACGHPRSACSCAREPSCSEVGTPLRLPLFVTWAAGCGRRCLARSCCEVAECSRQGGAAGWRVRAPPRSEQSSWRVSARRGRTGRQVIGGTCPPRTAGGSGSPSWCRLARPVAARSCRRSRPGGRPERSRALLRSHATHRTERSLPRRGTAAEDATGRGADRIPGDRAEKRSSVLQPDAAAPAVHCGRKGFRGPRGRPRRSIDPRPRVESRPRVDPRCCDPGAFVLSAREFGRNDDTVIIHGARPDALRAAVRSNHSPEKPPLARLSDSPVRKASSFSAFLGKRTEHPPSCPQRVANVTH